MTGARHGPGDGGPPPESDRDREVGDLFAARGAAIRASAYLLCGDWHLANDLTQTAFTKLYLAWHRVDRSGQVENYLRRTLMRAYLDERRRPWRRERPTAEFAAFERASAEPSATEQSHERMVVRRALAGVPPRQRAVLILRFWDDLSVQETAAVLRISTGTVKSQCARGLATLRALLAAEPTPRPNADTSPSRSSRHA